LRAIAVRRTASLRVAYGEAIQRAPVGAPKKGADSRLMQRLFLGASRTLDCFVAIGERSDAVLSNGYASQ
jgi:hypothetical protein